MMQWQWCLFPACELISKDIQLYIQHTPTPYKLLNRPPRTPTPLLHDLPSNSACVSCKTPGWPVTVKNSQSQSSSFLKWKTSFRSFFQKKSGRLDSGFLKYFHPLSTVQLCPPFQEYFLLIWSLDLQTVACHHTVQNDLLLKFHWTAVYFTWLQQSATTNWNIFSNSKNIFSYF